MLDLNNGTSWSLQEVTGTGPLRVPWKDVELGPGQHVEVLILEGPEMLAKNMFRARRIGANPGKSDLVNFRGPDWRKFSELCVLLFFLGKLTKCSQNPGLVNECSATPRGQENWIGPIANGSDMCVCYSNSVLTLYGLILAPILNLLKLPFLVLGS